MHENSILQDGRLGMTSKQISRHEKVRELLEKFKNRGQLFDNERAQVDAHKQDIFAESSRRNEQRAKLQLRSVVATLLENFNVLVSVNSDGEEIRTTQNLTYASIRDFFYKIDSNLNILNFEEVITTSETKNVLNNNGKPTLNIEDARRYAKNIANLINNNGQGLVKASVVHDSGVADGNNMWATESKYRIKIWVDEEEMFKIKNQTPTLEQVAEKRREGRGNSEIMGNMEANIRTFVEEDPLKVDQFQDGPGEIKQDSLDDFLNNQGQQYVIGRPRSQDNTSGQLSLRLENKYVSRTHAFLYFDGEEVILQCVENATNGTFVNGVLLEKGDKHSLEEGDIITFGGWNGETLQFTGQEFVPFIPFYELRARIKAEVEKTGEYLQQKVELQQKIIDANYVEVDEMAEKLKIARQRINHLKNEVKEKREEISKLKRIIQLIRGHINDANTFNIRKKLMEIKKLLE